MSNAGGRIPDKELKERMRGEFINSLRAREDCDDTWADMVFEGAWVEAMRALQAGEITDFFVGLQAILAERMKGTDIDLDLHEGEVADDPRENIVRRAIENLGLKAPKWKELGRWDLIDVYKAAKPWADEFKTAVSSVVAFLLPLLDAKLTVWPDSDFGYFLDEAMRQIGKENRDDFERYMEAKAKRLEESQEVSRLSLFGECLETAFREPSLTGKKPPEGAGGRPLN